MNSDDSDAWDEEIVELPIDGILDLHGFKPREVKDLVSDYIVECQKRGITEVRVIHGKGIGNLRRIVHKVMARHDAVKSFRLGGQGEGSWGATLADLYPKKERE